MVGRYNLRWTYASVVADLQLPALLPNLIAQGRWPTDRSIANLQNLRPSPQPTQSRKSATCHGSYWPTSSYSNLSIHPKSASWR